MHGSSRRLFALVCALLPGLGLADDAPPPADVSAALGELVDVAKVPAIAAAAIHRGKIVAVGASGIREVGGSDPVTTGDLFHIGSCTKSMTATLAALLVEDGQLRWDSTPAEVFEDIEIHADHRQTTLLQLLSNTGGCSREVPREIWAKARLAEGTEPEQRLEFSRAILAEAPTYPPGEGSEYSNAGFTIAGAMMETATGQPFDKLLTERVFAPLGMHSAGFGAPATEERPAQPHGHRLVQGQLVAVAPGRGADNPPSISPAGRIHCSISDFAKYAAAHLGNTPDLLDAETLAKLHRPANPPRDYALGWVVTERAWAGGTVLTHNGTNTMFYAVMWLAPAKNFAVVAACNVGGKDGAKACDDAASLLIRRFLEGRD